MRRVLLIMIVVIIFLSGCNRITEKESEPQAQTPAVTQTESTHLSPAQPVEDFSFRGHKFWDTLEQVIEKEGEYDRYEEFEETSYMITYDSTNVFGYNSELSYVFYDDGLFEILVKVISKDEITLEEQYYDIKGKLLDLCGEPTSEDEPMCGGFMTMWIVYDQKYVASIFYNEERLNYGMRAVMN